MQENFLHDKSVAAFIVTEYIQLKAFTTLHIQGTIAHAPHDTTWPLLLILVETNHKHRQIYLHANYCVHDNFFYYCSPIQSAFMMELAML